MSDLFSMSYGSQAELVRAALVLLWCGHEHHFTVHKDEHKLLDLSAQAVECLNVAGPEHVTLHLVR